MPAELTLSDALSHFAGVSTSTHQFWAYFQFIAAGAVTVAWSVPDKGARALTWLLSIAVTVFAIFNGSMVYGSQKDMNVVADAIHAYAHAPKSAVPNDLLPVIASICPAEPSWIAAAYVGLWGAALVGVWLPRWQRSKRARIPS